MPYSGKLTLPVSEIGGNMPLSQKTSRMVLLAIPAKILCAMKLIAGIIRTILPFTQKGERMKVVRFLSAEKMNEHGMGELLAPFVPVSAEDSREMVAVKFHPGEEGNSSYVSPVLLKMVLNALKLPERRTYLTDTTVLYGGRRMCAPDYIALAHDHGFRMPEFPPFIVADGLTGTEELKVDLPGFCETGTARLAGTLAKTGRAVVVSHFKGHLLAGFGGAIKNLGMGWASKAGKLYQHSSVTPLIREDKCIGCFACVKVCGSEAVLREDSVARIDPDRCTGCGECLQICPARAIGIKWDQEADTFMTRMTEYALAVTMTVDIPLYINFLTNVSPDCDCMKNEGAPMVRDIGVLASSDPVAIDQACLDLVTSAEPIGENAPAGHDKFMRIRPDRDGRLQLSIGERIGLGTREYTLETV